MSRKEKPRKAQTQQQRKTKRAHYRVRNWREYTASLVERGSVGVWVSEEVLADWKPGVEGPRPRGGQRLYSDRAIECVLKLLDAQVAVPDYTTLCKRGKSLAVNLPVSPR